MTTPDESSAEVVARPLTGIRRFRENCGVALRGGNLVVTDDRGRERCFPLDGSDRAPARYLTILGGPWWMIVDGRGEAIVRGANEDWDRREIEEVTERAGISSDMQTEKVPPPSLRGDAVVLEEPRWVGWSVTIVGVGSALSLAVAYAAQRDVLPVWAALVFFGVVWGFIVAGWRAGATAPARRGKSASHIEKVLADLGVEQRAGWQPPLPRNWRLAAEWQFGTLLLAGVVLLIDGEFIGLLVMPFVSLVFFGLTHWTMSSSRWAWWSFIVISNVGGVLNLIGAVRYRLL